MTAAAGEHDTSAKDDTENQDVEDTAAADQGDDTRDDSDTSDEEDWKAKFEAQQRIARKLERRNRADARRIAELEGDKPAASTKDAKAAGDAETVDVEKIRAEALEQAKKEAQQEALKERVNLTIEAKAAKGFADPVDAVVMLLRDHKIDDFIDDDNKIDGESIQDALKDLLEKKPYLGSAAQGGKNRFQGSAEGGAKPTKPARPQSLDEAVRRRLTPK